MTFLIGVDNSNVDWPLAQFQSTRFDQDDLLKLFKSMNAVLESDRQVPDSLVEYAFARAWEAIESALLPLVEEAKQLTPQPDAPPTQRAERSILEEILGLLRSQTGEIASLRPPEVLPNTFSVSGPPLRIGDEMISNGEATRSISTILDSDGNELQSISYENDRIVIKVSRLPSPGAQHQILLWANALGRPQLDYVYDTN